jgi:hypothetical protein
MSPVNVPDLASLADHIADGLRRQLASPGQPQVAEETLIAASQVAVEAAAANGILRDGRTVVDRDDLARWFHQPNPPDRGPDAAAYQIADELIDSGILRTADEVLREAAHQIILTTPEKVREFYTAEGRAEVRAAVVALAEGWIGFDDSHAFGETLLGLIDDPAAAIEPHEARVRARILRQVDKFRDTHDGPIPFDVLYAIIRADATPPADNHQPWPVGELTPHERLDAIAHLLRPCPPPDVYAGYDLCRCGYGGSYPCPTTRAAWHAQGVDIQTATREAIDALRPDFYPPELGEQ